MNLEKLNARDAKTVTPNDATDLTSAAMALYVGTGGNIQVTTVGGTTLTFTNVQGGSYLNVQVKRVWSTSTTASGIIALLP